MGNFLNFLFELDSDPNFLAALIYTGYFFPDTHRKGKGRKAALLMRAMVGLIQ